MSALQSEMQEKAETPVKRFIAFAGTRRIASGGIQEVASKVKKMLDSGEEAAVLIFDANSSETIEIDFRGTVEDVQKKLMKKPDLVMPQKNRGPGRPKLGVIGREVTLLPRHWEWLDEQPGGASVVLRKLVESAKRDNRENDRARRAQEAAHRFMTTMAGNFPGFEEASRAFYAGDQHRFDAFIKLWPRDIREHVKKLVAVAKRNEEAARQEETPK
jgi:hypothetical protein